MQEPYAPARVALAAITVLTSALTVAACVPRFPTPYTATMLARDSARHPGPALVHYLRQPTADPSVCDRNASTPRECSKYRWVK